MIRCTFLLLILLAGCAGFGTLKDVTDGARAGAAAALADAPAPLDPVDGTLLGTLGALAAYAIGSIVKWRIRSGGKVVQ